MLSGVCKCHYETAKFLIENKANVNAIDDRGGFTALHWAAGKGNDKIVTLLLENGADKTKKTFTNVTALDLAKAAKKKKVTEILEKENL